ncbi:MAG: alpha/beta fold hydrolase [Pseudarcicella sp.]|nr:alpha/beta fold hydrolase [Pseudarcicella sp.]
MKYLYAFFLGLKLLLFVMFLVISPRLFALKPSSIYVDNPMNYGVKYTIRKVLTVDKFSINTWTIPPKAKSKNKTIVLCSTDAGNISYFTGQALLLAEMGYRVILFDYRGFGQSQSFKTDTTLLFHKEYLLDFEATLKYARRQYPKDKIGAIGFSMGGYFPLITDKKLDFIIGESPLCNPTSFIERLNKPTLSLPLGFINPKPKNKIPQLYFLGSEDKFIKIEDTLVPYVVLYKGKHLGVYEAMGGTFFKYIDLFLKGLM